MGTVLLIEDDKRLQDLVSRLVKKTVGATVVAVASHEEAERWLAQNRCIGVITDNNTTRWLNRSGIRWLQTFQTQHSGVPVILYATGVGAMAPALSEQLGIPLECIIDKGGSPSELKEALKKYIPAIEPNITQATPTIGH